MFVPGEKVLLLYQSLESLLTPPIFELVFYRFTPPSRYMPSPTHSGSFGCASPCTSSEDTNRVTGRLISSACPLQKYKQTNKTKKWCYLITLVDTFTWWMETLTTSQKIAELTAQVHIIPQFGMPPPQAPGISMLVLSIYPSSNWHLSVVNGLSSSWHPPPSGFLRCSNEGFSALFICHWQQNRGHLHSC